MSTFVLVHGAFHGGWCWKRVTDRLRAAGHEVHVPTLTGCGERAHLLSAEVDLDTHITDVVNVLRWEDLRDVILVGHSYGGMPVTGAAHPAADRMAAVCYLDALWPADGQSVMDVVGGGAPTDVTSPPAPGREHVIEVGPRFAEVMGLVEPDDVAWVTAKATPMPLRTQLQPIALGSAAVVAPTWYVACMEQRHAAAFDTSLARARALASGDRRVRVREVDAPHDAMITHPGLVTDVLVELAGETGKDAVALSARHLHPGRSADV